MTADTINAPVRLSYQESGSGDPVVLIMGLNASGRAWQPHSQQWSRSLRCVAVDNRGVGNSPAPPGPYSTAAMAEDYAALIRRLDLGPCAVVGISMGGAIAQELALRHPALVRRLVLVATWARSHAYLRHALNLIGAVRSEAHDATFTALLQHLIWTPQWFTDHDAELQAALAEPLTVNPQALAAQLSACHGHDALHRLAHIQVPTLVTTGGRDQFVPAGLGAEVAAGIPGARLVVFADTGHVHHWEELHRFNDLVEEFLT